MNCPYVNITSYSNFPQCTLTDNPCPYMYRCTVSMTWKPLNTMFTCATAKRSGQEIPTGACKVRFKKNNFLYVEYKDGVVTVPYNNADTPGYVLIEEYNGEYKIKE